MTLLDPSFPPNYGKKFQKTHPTCGLAATQQFGRSEADIALVFAAEVVAVTSRLDRGSGLYPSKLTYRDVIVKSDDGRWLFQERKMAQ